MAKYYEEFKTIFMFSTLSGLYFPAIEKIYSPKWYIKSLQLIAILPILSLNTFLLSNIKAIFFDETDTLLRLQGFGYIIFSSYSAYAVFAYYATRKDFIRLFELWDSLFPEDLFSEKRKEVLEKNRNTVLKWFKIFTVSNTVTSITYTITGYFKPSKKLDHISGIPYKNASPDYELMVTLELCITFFGYTTLASYDSIVTVFFNLEEAQFKHLRNSLGQIFAILKLTPSGRIVVDCKQKESSKFLPNKNIYTSGEVFKYVDNTLKMWIDHHQRIIRFHNELQKIYHVQLSVKYFVFVLVICFVAFLSITGGFSVKDSIVGVVYTINTYALFYENLKFADSIEDVSRNITRSAFGNNWFLYPQKITTAMKIILLQSKRPAKFVTFRIYTLNSKTFRQILYSAYSFFTFLQQVTRNKN